MNWSDGAPFTAEDVKFTLEALRDAPPEVNGSAALQGMGQGASRRPTR